MLSCLDWKEHAMKAHVWNLVCILKRLPKINKPSFSFQCNHRNENNCLLITSCPCWMCKHKDIILFARITCQWWIVPQLITCCLPQVYQHGWMDHGDLKRAFDFSLKNGEIIVRSSIVSLFSNKNKVSKMAKYNSIKVGMLSRIF